jgi:hypothetical protein
MDERREKGLCFNCDNKYSKAHKCSEKKVFYIDNEEEEDQELEPSQDLELEETTPTISCHALANISTPQTLKIEGYIKKKKVTMLIDSGSTHNFINYKLAKDLNCFVYPTPEFQVVCFPLSKSISRKVITPCYMHGVRQCLIDTLFPKPGLRCHCMLLVHRV